MLRPIAILLAVVVFFLSLYFGYSKFLDWQVSWTTQKKISDLNNMISKSNSGYTELIKSQREKSAKDSTPAVKFDQLVAHGDHKIYFSFVFPSTSSRQNFSSLYERLITPCSYPDCTDTSTLGFINQFYSDEAKKYSVSDFFVSPVFLSPLVKSSFTKVGDMANVWQKDPFAVANLMRDFETLLPKDLKMTKDDVAVFLFFDDSVVGSQSRFYDSKLFRSFAEEEKKRAFVNVYDTDIRFGPTAVEIVAHEILHLFGASDKYAENPKDGICTAKGHGQITPVPTYPQTTADIMCGFIESSKGKFKRAGFDDKSLVINSITAKEIGW